MVFIDPNRNGPSSTPEKRENTDVDGVLDLSVKRQKIDSGQECVSVNGAGPVTLKNDPVNLSSSYSTLPSSSAFPMANPYMLQQFFGLNPLMTLSNLNSSAFPLSGPPSVKAHSNDSFGLRLPTTRAVPSQATPEMTPTSDTLDKLSSLVHQVGHRPPALGSVDSATLLRSTSDLFLAEGSQRSPNDLASAAQSKGPSTEHRGSVHDLWLKYMRKEESAELKRVSEAKQIFTCLQCHQSYNTMDQLVKHMEQTKHFSNVPKHYRYLKEVSDCDVLVHIFICMYILAGRCSMQDRRCVK